MGQRALLLILGALTIFGVATFAGNQFKADHNDAKLARELQFFAVALAQYYLEEARALALERKGKNGDSPAVRPGCNNFGALMGAHNPSYPYFEDPDDFNGYTDVVNASHCDFEVSITTGYVVRRKSDSAIKGLKLYREMTVTVSDGSARTSGTPLFEPVSLSHVFRELEAKRLMTKSQTAQ